MPRVLNRKNIGANPPNSAVYVGRPSKFGNPFVIGKDGDRCSVVERYREWLMSKPDLVEQVREELRDRDLICWCSPEACHADVLLEIANEPGVADPKPEVVKPEADPKPLGITAVYKTARSFPEFCRLYCTTLGVRSVPFSAVQRWKQCLREEQRTLAADGF